MKAFKDIKGRVWELQISVGSVRRIKGAFGIDIGNIMSFTDSGKPSVLDQIGDDVQLLFGIIWLLCEKQATGRGIDEQAFLDAMDGDSVEAAADALLDEIVNFSQPAQRKVLQKLRELSRIAKEKAEAQLSKILESPEFEKELSGISTPLSASSPESSV